MITFSVVQTGHVRTEGIWNNCLLYMLLGYITINRYVISAFSYRRIINCKTLIAIR